MIVWVLIIMTTTGNYGRGPISTVVIDNIATAESCEQLARVIRNSPAPAMGGIAATCAPVRKAVFK